MENKIIKQNIKPIAILIVAFFRFLSKTYKLNLLSLERHHNFLLLALAFIIIYYLLSALANKKFEDLTLGQIIKLLGFFIVIAVIAGSARSLGFLNNNIIAVIFVGIIAFYMNSL